jgi:menaquinol-cytochrome c reductase iron-sulfur subunit
MDRPICGPTMKSDNAPRILVPVFLIGYAGLSFIIAHIIKCFVLFCRNGLLDEEVRMSGSGQISRRDFVKLTTVAVGAFIGAVVGIPAIAYLVEPVLKRSTTDTWIPLGELGSFEIGTPTLATFTRSKVNGWEKTVNSYGVFVLRKSASELVVFSNVCTHLSCHVNWKQDLQEYVCPCHDGRFGIDGDVLAGPPPRPLDTYETKVEDGILSIHFLEG